MKLNLKLKQNYKAYLLIGYAFLLFIHFVIKDSIFPISTIFYSIPIPLLIFGGFIISLLYYREKTYFYSILLLQFALVFYWFNNFYSVGIEKTQTTNTSKILFWNVADKKQLPVDIIINETKLNSPNILAFVEAEHASKKDIDKLNKALPNYTFKDLKANMLVGVKGSLNIERLFSEKKSYYAYLINAKVNNETVNFIIADVYAYPFVNKNPPLNKIIEIAESNKVSFITGDFNTPYESVHFSSYFNNYLSFHSYGKGFTATWPIGLPLFEIDHIWISNELTPFSLEKKYFNVSDHALLIAEYE